MALCIRRYLVREEDAMPVLLAHHKLEKEYAAKIRNLQLGKSGNTVAGLTALNQELVNWFNDAQDGIFLSFLRKKKIARALDGRDDAPLSFDNFFKWSINCQVTGGRFLVEECAAQEKWLPFKEKPEGFRLLSDQEYYILSGGQKP